MGLPATKHFTVTEYLALEANTGIRHEYHDGVVTAMAGGTQRHARVLTEIAATLSVLLKGKPCKPFCSDLKVMAGGKVCYPDVTVLCSPVRSDDSVKDAATNPRVIFEVLSDSTEAYDRGAKFGFYRQCLDLTDYILVSPDRVYAEHYTRIDAEHWNLEFLGPGSVLRLASIECEMPLDAFYEGLELLLPES